MDEKDAAHAKYVANKQKFDEENEELLSLRNAKEVEIEELKEHIAEECISDYNETGVKEFQGGLKIRLNNRVNYDPDKALDWAKINMPAVVKQTLDKRSFDKFAKELDLDFVELKKEPSITYPSELRI